MTTRFQLIRLAQPALLFLLWQVAMQACAQTDPAELRIGATPKSPTRIVKVGFGTDRALQHPPNNPRTIFSNDLSPLHYGTCEVSIPANHAMGSLEWPGLFNFSSPNPESHVVLTEIAFDSSLSTVLTKMKGREFKPDADHVFVFVHGFANSFESACRRTAQMWFDLKLPGYPLMYSWASRNDIGKFSTDKEIANGWSDRQFKRFIADLVRNGVQGSKVHIVAHSMGTRLVMNALASTARASEGSSNKPTFGNVVLFAPEIPTRTFQDLLQEAKSTTTRVTLYGSASDTALKMALQDSPDPRAGDFSSSPIGFQGVEVIDASNVDFSLNGHTYYGDNRIVLADLQELLKVVQREQRRELEPWTNGQYRFRK